MIETAEVTKVFERKVWVESDFTGDKRVMIQHDDGESEPFCYCSFHYHHAHTSNSIIGNLAEEMAVKLGG